MLRRFESLLAVALAGILAGGGCTHWGTVNVYGQKQEVGRQLTGAPQVAETSSSNMPDWGQLAARLKTFNDPSPVA